MKIIVAGNGPSSQNETVASWLALKARTFRTNYFYEPQEDALGYTVHDWFICQHDDADFRACVAYMRGFREASRRMGHDLDTWPTFWVPGLSERSFTPSQVSERLDGLDVRVQRYSQLPAGCRWDADLAPQRPLMGSFAIAVAVGLQPTELYLCGHDLFQHPSCQNYGNMAYDTRTWQEDFIGKYLSNSHHNHTLAGDIKYLRAAFSEYKGHVTCVSTAMKKQFADEFPQWEWIDG